MTSHDLTNRKQPMETPRRILVVDDDGQVRFVLHDALARLDSGPQVVTAGNGDDALALVEEEPFDLIVTDLRMPGINGVELTERIRSLDANAAVIWMTAYGCHRFQDQAERLGVYRCLEKPLEIGEIRRVVQEAMEM